MKRWFGLIDATDSLLFFFVLGCYRQTVCTIEMPLNADGLFQFWMSDISQPNVYLPTFTMSQSQEHTIQIYIGLHRHEGEATAIVQITSRSDS